jgi:hypothetical protein
VYVVAQHLQPINDIVGIRLGRCGTFRPPLRLLPSQETEECPVNGLIYLVGLAVVVLAVLSFFGLR